MISEDIIHFAAHEFVHIDLQQILERIAFMGTVHHLRRVFVHIGHHPRLADILKVSGHMVVPFFYRMSAPDLMEQMRFELKGIKHSNYKLQITNYGYAFPISKRKRVRHESECLLSIRVLHSLS